jgi:hypothetical protein
MTMTGTSFSTRFWLGYGLGIWLIGTLAIRFLGQWLFLPESFIAITILFIISIPGMFALLNLGYRLENTKASDSFSGAAYILIPGLLLDGLLYAFPSVLLPNLSVSQAGLVATWLLWSYGWVMFAAFMNYRKSQ